MINKRKKSTRQRGHKTHGFGSMKKNRGAGHRGGRGNAGSGKRGDSKKPSFQQIKGYIGKHGFTKKGVQLTDNPINLAKVEDKLSTFEQEGICTRKNDGYHIDLSKAGYTKLLSKGSVSKKLTIHIDNATPRSIEKVEKAGGKVVSKINKESAPEKQTE